MGSQRGAASFGVESVSLSCFLLRGWQEARQEQDATDAANYHHTHSELVSTPHASHSARDTHRVRPHTLAPDGFSEAGLPVVAVAAGFDESKQPELNHTWGVNQETQPSIKPNRSRHHEATTAAQRNQTQRWSSFPEPPLGKLARLDFGGVPDDLVRLLLDGVWIQLGIQVGTKNRADAPIRDRTSPS